jgi:hypothetical protein
MTQGETMAAPATDPPTTASPIDEHVPPVNDQRTPEGYTRDGRAVAALVLGILSFPVLYFVGPFGLPIAIVAVVLGAVARGDMRRTGREGQGQATAGMVLGAIAMGISLVLFVIGLLVAAGS